jgi:hypothetical protein
MPEVKQQFTVADKTDEYLWLDIVEDESSIEVPVPIHDSQYPDSLKSQIQSLKEGTDIVATLISENDQNTAWRVKDLDSIKKPRTPSPVRS